MKLDNTDKKILNILQKDARTTMKEIGNEVSLTSPAAKERIEKMEDAGIIKGYTIDIDYSELNRSVSAFIHIDVPPKKHDDFIKYCNENKNIIEHHHIIGVYNAMIRVSVENTKELENLLREIRAYGISKTAMHLSTYFTKKDINMK